MSGTLQGPERRPPLAGSSAGRNASLAVECTDVKSRFDPGQGTPTVQAECLAAGISACLLPLHHCRGHWGRYRDNIFTG